MYELRSYQNDLIKKIINSMKHHHRVIIVQSPPRTGKTVSNGRNCQKNN
ncbi:DEAD/DEAH box helicase family protein [Lactobacillus helveticus]